MLEAYVRSCRGWWWWRRRNIKDTNATLKEKKGPTTSQCKQYFLNSVNVLCGRRSIRGCLFKLQGKLIDKHNTFIITLHAGKCMLEYKQWRQQYNKIRRPKTKVSSK